MNKLNKPLILILSLTFIFLNNCQGVRDNLSLKKKENSDEFLVQKKNPLVLPPDFTDLPEPEEEDISEEEETVEVKKILKGIANNTEISTGTSEGLEESILKKIKKN